MTISDDIRKLIGTGPLAHLRTLNPDGSPQVSVVWLVSRATSSSARTWAPGRK